jgi:DivIVA domain-containing protein
VKEITTTEIASKRFPTVRRGYDRDAVDGFLQVVGRAVDHDRELLRNALRRIEALEEMLDLARDAADAGSDAMLTLVETRQRFLEEATERAARLLRAGYEASLEDPEEVDRRVDEGTVELLAIWDPQDAEAPLLDLPSGETRYHRRSAHLPSLGEGSHDVYDELADLRSRARRHRR